MIETKNYVVFCEDDITIMFDKISGTFSEVPNEKDDNNNLSLIHI